MPIVTVQVGVKALPIIFRSLSPSVRTSPWPSGGIFAVLRWQPPQALNPRRFSPYSISVGATFFMNLFLSFDSRSPYFVWV